MDHKVPINIQMNEYYIYLKEIYKKNKYEKQNSCLRRPYKQLSKEEKQKAKEKRKDTPI